MIKYLLKDYLKEELRSGLEFKKLYNELYSHDLLNSFELQEIQCRMLINLIEYTYNNSSYYRNLFYEAGINYRDIKAAEDLKKLPILTKEDVRNNYNDIIINNKFRYLNKTAYTSGTTGKPLKLQRNFYSINYENANLYRLLSWSGYNKNDRIAVIRGDKYKNWYYYNNLNKRLYISSFNIINNLNEIYNLLSKYHISYIHCYPSSVEMISSFIINNDKKPYNLKAVVTSSEMVNQLLREKVKKAFNCKIFDYYGQAERVCTIMNCEKEEYHLMTDYGAEYLNDLGNNEYEVISTNLFNYTMPLINYSTGDLVEVNNEKPICNKKYPIISKIIGRKSDFIIIYGKKIYSAALTHIFYDIDDNSIIQSQFIQTNEKTIILNLIMEQENKIIANRISENKNKYIGENNIKIVINSKLVKTSNGKIPFIINYIADSYKD